MRNAAVGATCRQQLSRVHFSGKHGGLIPVSMKLMDEAKTKLDRATAAFDAATFMRLLLS